MKRRGGYRANDSLFWLHKIMWRDGQGAKLPADRINPIDLSSCFTYELLKASEVSHSSARNISTILSSCSPMSPAGYSSSASTSTPISLFHRPLRVLPSLRYIHFPPPPVPSFSCCLSPSITQSYLFGPDIGELSQICLFGGCLFRTYVPAGGRARVKTPAYK